VECPQYTVRLEALGYLCHCLSGRVQVVRVIWRKAHRRRRRMIESYSPGGANVSSLEGTLASLCEYDWTCASYGPLESTTHTANRSVQPFLHSWLQNVPIFYNGSPISPSKLPIPIGGIWTPCNTWFLGPTRVLKPNGNSIASAVFARLISVTDWPTDRPTDHATRSVAIGRMYLRSTAMRRNSA